MVRNVDAGFNGNDEMIFRVTDLVRVAQENFSGYLGKPLEYTDILVQVV
jgi:hypothetical protein